MTTTAPKTRRRLSLEDRREEALIALKAAVKQCQKARLSVVVDSDNAQIALIPFEIEGESGEDNDLKTRISFGEFETVDVNNAVGGPSGSRSAFGGCGMA